MVETTKRFRNPVVVAAAICAVMFYSRIIPVGQAQRFACAFSDTKIYALQGKVISSPQKQGNRYAFDLRAELAETYAGEKSSCGGVVRVYVPSAQIEAFFPGKLYSSSKGNFFNCESGALVELHGKFSDGIFYASDGKTLGWEKGFFGKVAEFRSLCRLQFKRLMYAWGNAGGLLLSLLSGAREYTEAATSNGFRGAGLSHVLALSGMHLSLVSSIVVFASIKISGRKISFALQAIALALFVWFAGASPSLLRALLCSVFALVVAVCGSGQIDMLVVLCASFLCHSVIKPADLSSAAFMLSYAALLGIITVGEWIDVLFSRVVPRKISSALSASAGAQTFTAPISAALFGTFAPVGVVASAVVSPAVTIFIYAGSLLILVCFLCPILVPIAGIFLNAIYQLIKIAVLIFAQFPVVVFG